MFITGSLVFLQKKQAQGQVTCGGWISPNAVVVDSVMDLSSSGGKTYWVCTGGELILRSCGGSHIFVESGGKVYIDDRTGGSHVYLKKGAILEAYNGLANQIYFEPGAIFTPAGLVYPCPLMVYNYSWAPANGCQPPLEETRLSEPAGDNPAGNTDVRVLTAEHGVALEFYNPLGETYDLQLFDVQGKVIESMKVNTGRVNLESVNHQPGMYFFRLQHASGIRHQGRLILK